MAYAEFVTAQNCEEWTSKGKIVNCRFSFNTLKNATVQFICFPNFPEQFIFLEVAACLVLDILGTMVGAQHGGMLSIPSHQKNNCRI